MPARPVLIPVSHGFPPRSLHAVYQVSTPSMQSRAAQVCWSPSLSLHPSPPPLPILSLSSPPPLPILSPSSPYPLPILLLPTQPSSQHMTRSRVRIEQQKADQERMQAITKVCASHKAWLDFCGCSLYKLGRVFGNKITGCEAILSIGILFPQALQSSEEARTAFRFSAHLEKMHTQLLHPDTVTPFRSHQEVLARLLPYHIWAEPEPPPAAIEKGRFSRGRVRVRAVSVSLLVYVLHCLQLMQCLRV